MGRRVEAFLDSVLASKVDLKEVLVDLEWALAHNEMQDRPVAQMIVAIRAEIRCAA